MKRPPRIKRRITAIAAFMAGATAAHADGFNYGIDAGIGETDNVTLVESNKVSQTMAVADLDFASKEKGSRLDEDITGNFTYLDFLQHAYGSEILGRLNGDVRYALVPESLTWTLQDNWGQTQVNPFGPLVPNNQENVNYLATGPDWHARLGSTAYLDVSARYARADYTVTPINSNRYSGTIQFGHDLSALSSVSINGSVERALYDDTVINTNYDLTSVFGRYELHGARTDLSVNLGVNKVTAGGESNSGFSAQLQLTRKLSQAAKLTITAGRELTDAASGFNTLQNGNLGNIVNVNSSVNNAPAPVTSSIYTSNYLLAVWQYERNRTTLGFNGRVEKDVYVNQPQYDGSRDQLGIDIERKLTHALSAQVFANVYQTRYDHDQFLANSAGYTDRDGLYGLTLTLREGRGLEIKLRFEHMSRDISSGVENGYQENRIFLTMGYRPQPSS